MILQRSKIMSKYVSQKSNVDVIAGVVALVIFVIAVLSGLGYWIYLGFQKPEFDKVTACPIENGKVSPHSHTVILVDTTDPLTPQQIDAFKVGVNNIAAQLSPGDLLEIYKLNEEERSYKAPVFSHCKTRDGSDADELTENKRRIQRKFEKEYNKPLQLIINNLINTDVSAKRSPIIESIQSISVNSFEKWNIAGNRHLIIFSDMLQHVPEFSMYKNSVNYKNFSKSDYAAKHKPYMPDVEVTINIFNNNPKLQKMSTLNFWQKFFSNAGASVTETYNLGQ